MGYALAPSPFLSDAWAALLLAGFVAYQGVPAARGLIRRRTPAMWLGLGLGGAGVLGSLLWQARYGPATPIATHAIRLALVRVPLQIRNAAWDLVAGFGYPEFRLPLSVFLAWLGFIASLVLRSGV